MQEAFKDGSLGDPKPFNLEGMEKLLDNLKVDYVRVFRINTDKKKKARMRNKMAKKSRRKNRRKND